MKHLYICALILLLTVTVHAQYDTVPPPPPPVPTSPETAPPAGTATLSRQINVDSLRMAVTNVQQAFGELNKYFASRLDTMTIMIAGVDYDNSNLASLKEYLKKTKGVKAVTTKYKDASAILEISYRGKAIDLWDKVPIATRSAFKVLEVNENNIMLQAKN